MKTTFRLALSSDLGAFEEMLRAFLLEQAAAGSTVQVTRRTVDWYRDLARSYVLGSLFGVLVLAEEGAPVGFALAGEDLGQPRLDSDLGRQAAVWAVWVNPAHRKHGTGLAMLSFGRPLLVDQGFQTAVTSVREGNVEGDALTRGFGARPMEQLFRVALREDSDG